MAYYNEQPSHRMNRLYYDTDRLFHPLASRVAPYAQRRPDQPAAPGIVADARALLSDCARLVSRRSGFRGRLTLVDAPSWAELDAKLALGATALEWLRKLHYDWERAEADCTIEDESDE